MVRLLSPVLVVLCLACGGGAVPVVEEQPVVVPKARKPKPPEVRSKTKNDVELPDDVTRRLRAANGLIRACMAERRAEIPAAREPIAMSAEVRVRRDGGMGAELTHSGFGAPEVVDACVLEPLLAMDTDGLGSFDVVWQVVVDFP